MEFKTLVDPNIQANAERMWAKDQISQGPVVSLMASILVEAFILCITGATADHVDNLPVYVPRGNTSPC